MKWEKIENPHSFMVGKMEYFDKNITLSSNYEEYAFGISAESGDSSSGITWSRCIHYSKNQPGSPEIPSIHRPLVYTLILIFFCD